MFTEVGPVELKGIAEPSGFKPRADACPATARREQTVASVRNWSLRYSTGSSEGDGMDPQRAFARAVLEGAHRMLVDNIDGIYGYFRGLADGAIGSGSLSKLD